MYGAVLWQTHRSNSTLFNFINIKSPFILRLSCYSPIYCPQAGSKEHDYHTDVCGFLSAYVFWWRLLLGWLFKLSIYGNLSELDSCVMFVQWWSSFILVCMTAMGNAAHGEVRSPSLPKYPIWKNKVMFVGEEILCVHTSQCTGSVG